MKALCVKQPFAGLIAAGVKTIELRDWKTNYRGELLICASAAFHKGMENHYEYTNWNTIKAEPRVNALCNKLGQALVIVELIDCRQTAFDDCEKACADALLSKYAWVMKFVRRIRPFKIKGQLNIFDIEFPNKNTKEEKFEEAEIVYEL